jgi:hypothetical protein
MDEGYALSADLFEKALPKGAYCMYIPETVNPPPSDCICQWKCDNGKCPLLPLLRRIEAIEKQLK